MIANLPFVGRIFWKSLVVVAILIVAGWLIIPRVMDYTITAADYGGSTISGIILSYLVHLWLLPEDHPPEQEDES